MQKPDILHCRRLSVCVAVCALAGCFVVNLGMKAYAQEVKRKAAVKKEESYNRPKPTRPIKPEIPGANRYQQDKIFLEYADSLYKVQNWRDTTEKQILKGNVKFRQAGMWMYCDSAYYYPELNSLDAFGNVKMEQGDTLFVYADKLYYEGNERMARLKNGPSREKVNLINRDVTLTTDSLDYSLAMELGWYEKWGTIDDKVNTLTSLYGEYSPGTKNADFYHDVVLVNNENSFTMLTDTLHYNTDTHLARIESTTEIQGANDTIITTEGIYDTELGNAELLSRSLIIHRDSNNNVTTLEGDSIIYDKISRISRAYMFRDPDKHSMPMVLTDTAHRTTLIGGFGIYNDSTREALATEYPLLMEYSQNDTLFLRADTIRTYIITEMVADGRRWTASGFPESNGVPIVKASDMSIWVDSLFFSVIAPLVEAPLRLLTAALPARKVNDSKPKAAIPAMADLSPAQHSPDGGEPSRISAISDSLAIKTDSLLLSDADSLNRADSGDIPEIKQPVKAEGILPGEISPELSVETPGTDTAVSPEDSVRKIPKDFHVALAYHRARFFKQDLQGVADSMVFVERDSMMYMFRKPIVWSGERQVTGNRIDIHFNDSTADWAVLPESGMMSEHVDEDFYNQLSGKTLFATFENQTLKRLEVSGNVETIFLPQEADSTYNRMVVAESSFLTIDLDSNKMDRLKMWPEVTGKVTPIFLVKKADKYLQKFRWWGTLRPEREWYGDRLHWADNLGEVPDALEQYFLAPSDFGEPKSFSGTRFVAPPTSLPLADDIPAIELPAPDSIATLLPGDASLDELEKSEEEENKTGEEATEESAKIEKAVSKEESAASGASSGSNGNEGGVSNKENPVIKEDEE